MAQVGEISSKQLMQRVGSMFGLNNNNWHGDGIDWIGDAIEAIGYHCGFDNTEKILEVKNYRVAIPSGMESIEYIKHNGYRLILGTDESSYGFVRSSNGRSPNILNYEERLSLSKEIDRLNALREMAMTVDVIAAIENSMTKIDNLIGSAYLGEEAGNWRHNFYIIESTTQYIKTSFESGRIEVYGRSFKLDKEGYPLVVNTYKYKEAISWFIISRLLLRGEKHPVLTYEEADEKFDGQFGFRNQAANEAKMPGIDQMERFTQRWTSIKRETTLDRYI